MCQENKVFMDEMRQKFSFNDTTEAPYIEELTSLIKTSTKLQETVANLALTLKPQTNVHLKEPVSLQLEKEARTVRGQMSDSLIAHSIAAKWNITRQSGRKTLRIYTLPG